MNIFRSKIKKVLESGDYIRMIDGRYKDGYADLEILRAMIRDGQAEEFNNKGIKMARLPRKPDWTCVKCECTNIDTEEICGYCDTPRQQDIKHSTH